MLPSLDNVVSFGVDAFKARRDYCQTLRGFRHFVPDNMMINRSIHVRNFVFYLLQDSGRDVV